MILKSHSHNRDGWVRLRSNDPRDTPRINFNSFQTATKPGQSETDPDVLALLDGVKFVQGIFKHAWWTIKGVIHPEPKFLSSDAGINEWIRRDAWGHHASGTCRMGPDKDPDAVLDTRFRVRGVRNLRVVDASIFPRIPGYFIVTNIYMASEKAADVILDDARRTAGETPKTYPAELRALEIRAIATRRAKLAASTADMAAKTAVSEPEQVSFSCLTETTASAPIWTEGAWRDDVTGLALSGGGIRSSTFCLGILQALARHQRLRTFDFLSTVSGGGYIGSFLGRFYDRLRPNAAEGTPLTSAASPADRVEQELVSPDSKIIDWLRKHGNYIAPRGESDGRTNVAVFVRNLLSIHLVVGLAIFTLFGIANILRYGFDLFGAAGSLATSETTLPLTRLMMSWFGPFFSSWFLVVDLLILILVLPRIVGYWIVSQDKHETFSLVPTLMLFFVAGGLLYLGVSDGLKAEMVSIGLALLISLGYVESAWSRGRQMEDATGTGNVETQRLRTRNYFTEDLGLALGLTGIAIGFALIDTIGFGLQEWLAQNNVTYVKAFAALGAAIATAFPIMRIVADFIAARQDGPPNVLRRLLTRDMLLGLMALALFALPLILYSFSAHVAFSGDGGFWRGVSITLVTAGLTLVLALPQAVPFVNRSSLAQTYSARLARAFLGASNPLRQRPGGIDVTEVIPGDDVPSIVDYRPHEASGPFHLINVTIDQTVDKASLLRRRDRQGDILAVSCLAMSVGEKFHSAWERDGADTEHHKAPTRLVPLGRATSGEHPLLDTLHRPAEHAEMLSLRQWIGISGAAIDPGRGAGTNLGMALLSGIVNLRTGYWWDSSIAEAYRAGFPTLSLLRRCLYVLPRVFTTQSLLLREWVARFPGTWERFWHFSDGGFFECLGGYELIRRRVPRIVICDGCADPRYEFGDLGELVRKVRVDFGARIESFTIDEVARLVPEALLPLLGTQDELRPSVDPQGRVIGTNTRHAGLFWVHYPDGSRRSVLMLIKAKLSGDETADVENYHAIHPEFPHEGTADQFFDEAQWESYRKLGEHLGDPLFSTSDPNIRDWFWRIPLTPSM